jgi:hypothetical protein
MSETPSTRVNYALPHRWTIELTLSAAVGVDCPYQNELR